ncbi:hypothetical protein [Paenisporosarcina sp. OV554]|nr:hypothetical protein [Paenisporosarcina sp. OV554]
MLAIKSALSITRPLAVSAASTVTVVLPKGKYEPVRTGKSIRGIG